MGFFSKFALKKGIGSPGETAKTFCDRLKFYYEGNHSSTWNSNFTALVSERLQVVAMNPMGVNKDCLYDPVKLYNEVVPSSEGSLSLLVIMMMILETGQFRKGVYLSREIYDETIQIIYDTVQRNTPYANTLSLFAVNSKGYHFLLKNTSVPFDKS